MPEAQYRKRVEFIVAFNTRQRQLVMNALCTKVENLLHHFSESLLEEDLDEWMELIKIMAVAQSFEPINCAFKPICPHITSAVAQALVTVKQLSKGDFVQGS